MGTSLLEFEKPIAELERQIQELREKADAQKLDLSAEIAPLQERLAELRRDTYKNLTPLQRVQVARSSRRPFTLDYIRLAFSDFIELHGDRAFRDDPSIVGGWARLAGDTEMIIGQQRGRDTKENIHRNFGMPHPEGYRKALRL
ncbi:MAG: acetyl-CoA carboxylase carboxyl transferase subunit alpha, partial [Gemmatimonadota bacterium]